jgi:hypothetical protein
MKKNMNPYAGDTVPQEVEARLRERLSIFRQELAGKEQRKLSRPIFRLALGGAALTGLLIVAAVLFPGRGSVKGLYADVVKELSARRTIAYTVVISPGAEVEVISKFPGLERKKLSWGIEMISDERKGKTLLLFHTEKTYLWESVKGTFNGVDNLNSFEGLPEKAEQELGKRVIDGRSAVGFRVTKDKLNQQAHTDIWIDPVTRRLVHVDIEFEDKGVVVHRMEIKNIRVNEPVDDSLFELTPPAGFKPAAEPARKSMAIFGPLK